MYKLLAFISVLFLAGCASTGVRVVHLNEQLAVQAPRPISIAVSGDDEATVSAARQALASTSNIIPSSSPPSSRDWLLYTSSSVEVESRLQEDPFCRRYYYPYPYRYYPYPYRLGYWDPFYGRPYPLNCDTTVRTYPVMTITWTLENPQGDVMWQAQSRQVRSTAAPIEPSIRLARSLDEWLNKVWTAQTVSQSKTALR